MRAPLCVLGLATFALGAAWSSNATAQEAPQGVALPRFNPAPAGDRMFGVPSPYVAGDPGIHVMLLGDYGLNPAGPVVIEGTDEDLGSIVGHQLIGHLNATLALWHRLHLNVDIPVALVSEGDQPPLADDPKYASLVGTRNGSAFGDIRAGLRVSLFGDYYDPFQLGLGGYLWFPTAQEESYMGTGEFRGQPQLLLGGHVADRMVWSFMFGPEIRSEEVVAGLTQGTMLDFGAGVGFLLDDEGMVQLGPEADVKLMPSMLDSRTMNAEVLLDLRIRPIDDLEFGIGAGPGLVDSLGTPDFRGVAMIAYSEKVDRHSDRDADGIEDSVDACPDEPGPPNADPALHGCPPPPPDRDLDGIIDGEDACPDQPGPRTDDPQTNGCPPPDDRDGDGIVDAQDACPDEPGIMTDDPATHGCPDRDGDSIIDKQDACPDVAGTPDEDPALHGCTDTDGDQIKDPVDACPNEKGEPNADPAKHGCPGPVQVTQDKIVITERVEFDTARATIQAVSFPLLDAVAKVFKDHPEITKVEVQGHTDDRGADAYNLNLSNLRAQAVRKALMDRGVEADRMVAKGYGEAEPIASNDTDEGRQDNRRVEFKILERDESGASSESSE